MKEYKLNFVKTIMNINLSEGIYIYVKEHPESVNHYREGWSTSASKTIQQKTTFVKIVRKVASLDE